MPIPTSARRLPEFLCQLPSNYKRPGTTRTVIVCAVAITSLLCCGAAGPVQCQEQQIGPSGAEVAGIAVAAGAVIVGTVVLIEVNHSHHTVKGCVFIGPQGPEVRTQNDQKTYVLDGVIANVKVGDLVQFHGTRVKKVKNSTGDQTFTVEKISRDFGPCKASLAPPAPAVPQG
jgi:hypothetical protein